MKILVTGGAGFIGINLCQTIITNGHQVICVDAGTYAANEKEIGKIPKNDNFTLIWGNVCNKVVLSRILERHQPDAIVHLAAESHVDRSIIDAQNFIQTNIVGTYTLLDATFDYWKMLTSDSRESFRFLHVSTDEVYGSLGVTGKFTEQTPYAPNSPYAASKAASDHLVLSWYHTYGLPVVVEHCSNNYGPYQHSEKFIPTVIANACKGIPIPVYGNGKNIRDWIFVNDHVDAICTILAVGKAGQIYNVGADNEVSNIDLVHQVCNLVQKFVNDSANCKLIQFVEDRKGHDFRYAVDASKIQRELGWHPTTSFADGLKKTIQWYLQNRSLQ